MLMLKRSPGTVLLNSAVPSTPPTVAVVLAPGVPPCPLALLSVTLAPLRPVPAWSLTGTVRVPFAAVLAQPDEPAVGSRPWNVLLVAARTQIGPSAPLLV